MENTRKKMFMQVGSSFVDIAMCAVISFYRVDGHYVYAAFSYDTGQTLPVELMDRAELSKFLLQLDEYVDGPESLKSINAMISQIEALPVYEMQEKRDDSGQRYIHVDPNDE